MAKRRIVQEERAEIIQANKSGLADSTPLGHRVIEGSHRRAGHNRDIDDQDRRHEEPRHHLAAEAGGLPGFEAGLRQDENRRLGSSCVQ